MASLPAIKLTFEQRDQVFTKVKSMIGFFNFLHTNRVYYMSYHKSIAQEDANPATLADVTLLAESVRALPEFRNVAKERIELAWWLGDSKMYRMRPWGDFGYVVFCKQRFPLDPNAC
jgi:hypothetical protein